MSNAYKERFNQIRAQQKTNEPELAPINGKEAVVREDELLGDIELVTDANDLPSEIKKNLESNLGPVDTEAEKIAKGLDHKDDEPSFRP